MVFLFFGFDFRLIFAFFLLEIFRDSSLVELAK